MPATSTLIALYDKGNNQWGGPNTHQLPAYPRRLSSTSGFLRSVEL